MATSPYNLTICQLEIDWEFNNQCSIYVASGESADAIFTIDKNYNFNFVICNDTQDEAIQTTIDFLPEVCPEEMRVGGNSTGESASSSLDFTPLYILAPGQASDELNLNVCIPTSDFNLSACKQLLEISGKNYNHDINLCNEPNPPLYADPHRFQFHYTQDWDCDIFSTQSYTGETCSVSLQGDVLLPMDFNYTGESGILDHLYLEVKFYNSLGYTGESADVDFEDNPFDKLEPNVDTGESADVDFSPTAIFDADVTTGEYADVDFEDNPFDKLEPNVDTGEYADTDLENAPQFVLDSAYTGESVDVFTFDDHPAVELLPNVDTGEYADVEAIYIFKTFSPDVDTGEYADADLTDFAGEEMLAEGYTGESADVFDMATTFALYPNVYTGELGNTGDINLDTVLTGEGYTGEYSEADFYANVPFEMIAEGYTGESGVSSINTTLTMFPRTYTGESSDSTMTTFVSDHFVLNSAYTGESALDFTLEEETEYYIAIGGESSDSDLTTDMILIVDAYTGESVDIAYISLEAGFAGDITTSEQALIPELYVTPGQEFEANVDVGENVEAGSNGILAGVILHPEIIISSQTFYDGWGGEGGLNFCENDCCHGQPDALNLVLDVRSSDREPWGKCGPLEDTAIFVNLTGNVRLEADVTTGENTVSFIQQEYITFSFMGDDEYIIYNREIMPEPQRYYWTFEADAIAGEGKPSDFMFLTLDGDPVYDPELTDNFDHAISIPAQGATVDLEVPAWIEYPTGENMIVSLSYDEAPWKYAFKHFQSGEQVSFNMEAKEYVRFCPGYLIPEGDNVIFDFASPIWTGCSGWFAGTGESVEKVFMKTTIGLGTRQYTGERATMWLKTYPYVPWDFRARTGERGRVNNGAELTAIARTGEYGIMYMPRRQAEGYTGEQMDVFLDISLPSVVWVSPSECVPNIYNPLTPDGDIDEDYENFEICVEDMPYVGKLEAECTNDFTYYPRFHLEVIGNNITATLDHNLAVVKQFSPNCYSGENSYILEWNVNTGEEMDLELTIFVPAELEPNVNTDEAGSAFVVQAPAIPIEPSVYTDENVTILDFG